MVWRNMFFFYLVDDEIILKYQNVVSDVWNLPSNQALLKSSRSIFASKMLNGSLKYSLVST